MYRVAVLLGLAMLLILPACARDSREVSQRDIEQQRPVAAVPDQTAGQQQAVVQQPSGQQGQTKQEAEFMGVAPKLEDIPETLTFEAKNGKVTFPHREHAKTIDCATCHQGAPGKIEGFGKDKAHSLCKGCHQEKNAGPTKCGDCHKKS